MKLLFVNNRFEESNERFKWAQRLSLMIEGHLNGSLPYPPNSDTWYYQLDEGNDWHVQFYDNDPKSFSIHYRYNARNQDKEMSFCRWLSTRYHGLRITDLGWPKPADKDHETA